MYVLLRRGDEVLLQRRQNTGYRDGFWASGAAGHIELGESMIDAAIRETAEELGVTIAVDHLQPLCTMLRTQGNNDPTDERVDFFYQCRQWDGVPSIEEPEKVSDLQWFDLGALPDPVVPHELRLLNAVATGEVPILLAEGFDQLGS